jgi:hypothetical protein
VYGSITLAKKDIKEILKCWNTVTIQELMDLWT